jgi:hypothetical protein
VKKSTRVKSAFRASLFVGTIVAAVFAGSITTAHATMFSFICSDINCNLLTDVRTDDNALGDLSSTTGVIQTSSEVVGGVTVETTTAESKPQIGSASDPSLSLAYSLSGAGSVWLYVSDSDFLGSQVASVTNSTITGSPDLLSSTLYGGIQNTVQGLVLGSSSLPQICTTGIESSSPFNGSCSGAYGGVGPYALLLGVHIEQTEGSTVGQIALNATPATVPEPGSLALLAAGMLGVVLVGRHGRPA